MTASAPSTILVLSEDSGRDGRQTVKKVLERLLLCWRDGLRVLELDAESEAPTAAHANKWRSTAPRDYRDRVAFVRRLATELSLRQGPAKLIVFHYDGDTTWEHRAAAQTPQQFERSVRRSVAQLLAGAGLEERLGRLIEMVPHYSVEAWAYQATDVAVDLCNRLYNSQDVQLFGAWARERHLLDELERPKDRTVLAAKHNVELCARLPAAAVIGIDKSLAEFARRLLAAAELAGFIRNDVYSALVDKVDGPDGPVDDQS